MSKDAFQELPDELFEPYQTPQSFDAVEGAPKIDVSPELALASWKDAFDREGKRLTRNLVILCGSLLGILALGGLKAPEGSPADFAHSASLLVLPMLIIGTSVIGEIKARKYRARSKALTAVIQDSIEREFGYRIEGPPRELLRGKTVDAIGPDGEATKIRVTSLRPVLEVQEVIVRHKTVKRLRLSDNES